MADTINPANSDWITLTSKYLNKCKVCGKEIDVGTKCLWKKGEGIKCLEGCVAELLEEEPKKPLITEKEWKDFQKYSYDVLQKIKTCQRCGNSVGTGDGFYDDDRRVCRKCF